MMRPPLPIPLPTLAGKMLRIRCFTPPVLSEEGAYCAGGELVVGDGRLFFMLDLSRWSIAQYQRQWQTGIDRLVRGAPSTALMTAFRRDPTAGDVMWALWREDSHIYIQEHTVIPAELDEPFDPNEPYAHVGA